MHAFADNVRMAAAWRRTAEERRKDAKAPFLSGGREIDAWFSEVGAAIMKPLQSCQKAMDAYQAKVAAEARRIAEEEARRRREEADAAAAAAAAAAFADGDDSEEDAERVTDMVAGAQRAAGRAAAAEARAEGTVAQHVRTHSDLGTVATAKEVIEFDVIDDAQVPREFMVVDQNRIRAWVRDHASSPEAKTALRKELEAGRQPIAGIRLRIETKALVR